MDTPPFSTITGALPVRASVTPDRTAYVVNGESVTYGALAAEVSALAGALVAHGVQRGDRCALLLPTSLDFIRLFFAVQYAGAIPAPINPGVTEEQLERRLRLLRCRLVIGPSTGESGRSPATDREFSWTAADELRATRGASAIAPMALPDDPSHIMFTSGTTGTLHAAVMAHRRLLVGLAAFTKTVSVTSDDVMACWVPLYFSMGLSRYVLVPMFNGCVSHCISASLRAIPEWLELVGRVRATITGGSDFAFRAATRLVDPADVDLRSLRFASGGGEAIRLETIQAFERRFGVSGVVRPTYGMTENSPTVACVRPGQELPVDADGHVSVGQPSAGAEFRVVDESGAAVPAGETGELVVRSPWSFLGYFDDEEATREKMRDGWLHTGDLGRIDPSGNVYVLGRLKSMIKRGGAQISPQEIEQAAERVTGVAASAAIGVAQQGGSERVVLVAEIEGMGSPPPEEACAPIVGAISTEVRNAVGVVPGDVILVAPGVIPRTGSGKKQYAELRRLIAERILHTRGPVWFEGGEPARADLT